LVPKKSAPAVDLAQAPRLPPAAAVPASAEAAASEHPLRMRHGQRSLARQGLSSLARSSPVVRPLPKLAPHSNLGR
jgi:hypothetical protein